MSPASRHSDTTTFFGAAATELDGHRIDFKTQKRTPKMSAFVFPGSQQA